jgi:hypothetical protein
VLPDCLTAIADYTFSECASLVSVVFPNGLTSIGRYAFQSCAVEQLLLPRGLGSIGDGAFRNCQQLVKLEPLPPSLTAIGRYVNLGMPQHFERIRLSLHLCVWACVRVCVCACVHAHARVVRCFHCCCCEHGECAAVAHSLSGRPILSGLYLGVTIQVCFRGLQEADTSKSTSGLVGQPRKSCRNIRWVPFYLEI